MPGKNQKTYFIGDNGRTYRILTRGDRFSDENPQLAYAGYPDENGNEHFLYTKVLPEVIVRPEKSWRPRATIGSENESIEIIDSPRWYFYGRPHMISMNASKIPDDPQYTTGAINPKRVDEFFRDPYTAAQKLRVSELQELAGDPEVFYNGGSGRAYSYTAPKTGPLRGHRAIKIYGEDLRHDYESELAHHVLNESLPEHRKALKWPTNPDLTVSEDGTAYDTKKYGEYTTHSVIQPLMNDYIDGADFPAESITDSIRAHIKNPSLDAATRQRVGYENTDGTYDPFDNSENGRAYTWARNQGYNVSYFDEDDEIDFLNAYRTRYKPDLALGSKARLERTKNQ